MTRGTLKTLLEGTEIKGTFNYVESGMISFTPYGARTASFFPRGEWVFEADKPELPTEDGYYIGSSFIEHDGSVSRIGAVFRFYQGAWSCINGRHANPGRWAQDVLESQGLTRITFVVDN